MTDKNERSFKLMIQKSLSEIDTTIHLITEEQLQFLAEASFGRLLTEKEIDLTTQFAVEDDEISWVIDAALVQAARKAIKAVEEES